MYIIRCKCTLRGACIFQELLASWIQIAQPTMGFLAVKQSPLLLSPKSSVFPSSVNSPPMGNSNGDWNFLICEHFLPNLYKMASRICCNDKSPHFPVFLFFNSFQLYSSPIQAPDAVLSATQVLGRRITRSPVTP